MRLKHGTVPGLAVIMVGERRDSEKYVSMKQVHLSARMCECEMSLLNCVFPNSNNRSCPHYVVNPARCQLDTVGVKTPRTTNRLIRNKSEL